MAKDAPQRRLDSQRTQRAGNVTITGVAAGGGGVTDHGLLSGLGDDDHLNLLNAERGDARYPLLANYNLHVADPDAHHARATAGNGLQISGQQLSVKLPTNSGLTAGAAGLALGTPGALSAASESVVSGTGHAHAIAASADVSGDGAGVNTLLKGIAGAVKVKTLEATTRLRAPLLDTAAGNLSLAPAGWIELAAGKLARSPDYSSGFAGAGFAVGADPLDAGHTFAEVDNLWVRGQLNVYELLLHKIRAVNGSFIVSGTGKVSALAYAGGADWDVTTDPEHGFTAGDLIRAQKWTGREVYVCNMTVKASPAPTATTFRATFNSGVSPAVGMEFVRLGNTSDPARQGGVYLTADDSGAPFIDVFAGVNSHAAWNTAAVRRVRMGQLSGITGQSEYGLFAGVGQAASDAYLKISTAGVTQNNITSTWTDAGVQTIGISAASGIALSAAADRYSGNIQRRIRFLDGVNAVALLEGFGTGAEVDRGLRLSGGGFAAGQRGRMYLDVTGALGSSLELWAAGAASPGVFVELNNTNRNNPYIALFFEDEGGIGASNDLRLDNAGLWTDKAFGAASGSFTGAVAAASVRAAGAAGLRLEDDGGSLGVLVADGGNVGIGVSPATALHVRGASPVVRIDGNDPNVDQPVQLCFYDRVSTLKGRLIYAGGNSAGNKYFGFINDSADDLRFFSDLTQFWSSSAELARLASTGLFTLRYGRLDAGGAGVGNNDASVRVGVNRGVGAEGLAYVDLFSDNTAQQGARLVKRAGANGNVELVGYGTGETLINASNASGTLGLYVASGRRLRMPGRITLPITVDYSLPEAYTGLVIFANRTTGGYGIYGVNPGNNAAVPIVKIAENGFDWTANTAGTIRFYRSAANPAVFNLRNNIGSGGPHEIVITWIGAC